MDPLQFVLVPLIEEDQGMEIPVPGVEDVGDRKTVFLADFDDPGQRLGELASSARCRR